MRRLYVPNVAYLCRRMVIIIIIIYLLLLIANNNNYYCYSYFIFFIYIYSRDALHSAVFAVVRCLSVRMSVCPSVCLSHSGIVYKV